MQWSRVRLDRCPVCESSRLQLAFSTKDFSVSGEVFELWDCTDCSLRFTQDVPDAASIKAFYQSEDYISHSDTQRGLINQLYHWVRRRTLKNKQRLIESTLGTRPGLSLLDIGAGTGAFLHHMEIHGWQTRGVEPDPTARKRAKELYGVELLPTESLSAIPDNSFDAITLWHVLEHIHYLHPFMNQLVRLIKTGGIVFIAVPNYGSKDARLYREFWAAYDVPRHLYHFSAVAMKRLLELHDLDLVDMRPMWYDSFYICLLSEKYRHGRSRILPGLVNGVRSNLNALINKVQCSSLMYLVRRKT